MRLQDRGNNACNRKSLLFLINDIERKMIETEKRYKEKEKRYKEKEYI